MKRFVPLLLAVACAIGLGSAPARADDDPGSLFASANAAIAEGRAGDAVSALEAMADRGVVDPVASYDRGLAYAMRVRLGTDAPGDLGRAAQGFEEALDLTSDGRLADDAARGLIAVRSEIARRRARAGEPVVVDPARSLGRAVAGLLSEDTWAVLALFASGVVGLGLTARRLARSRARVAGGISAGVAAPVLLVAVVMTLAARSDRLNLREAVVVASGARPTDERGLAVPGATSLPEGARVEVVEARGSLSRVRFGAVEAWVSSAALREIARRG